MGGQRGEQADTPMRCVLCGGDLKRTHGGFFECVGVGMSPCPNNRQYVADGRIAYKRPARMKNPIIFAGGSQPVFTEMASSPEGCLVPFEEVS